MENWNELPSLPDEEELKKIRKSLKYQNRKTILTSLVLATALILLFAFAVVPAAEKLYWSPYTYEYSDGSDLKLMLEAYTELLNPGKEIRHLYASDIGFASYDLSVMRVDSATGEETYLNGSMIRGKIDLDYPFFDTSEEEMFLWGNNNLPEEMMTRYTEDAAQRLSALPDYITVKAVAFFPKDLTMKQIQQLIFKYNFDSNMGVDLCWIGIRNAPQGAETTPIACGFSTAPGTSTKINEFYPGFRLNEVKSDGTPLETHFKALLQFSADQADKGHGLFVRYKGEDLFRHVLDYVEENGVLSYGCLVTGTPDGLLAMLEDGTAESLILTDGWIDVS